MRRWVPLGAGLAVAAVTFAVVAGTNDPADPPEAAPPGTPGSGGAVFARMGCGSCHTLAAAGSTGTLGPDLGPRLDTHSVESLKAVILKPPPGNIMPTDFGRRMTDAELDALVRFLLSARS